MPIDYSILGERIAYFRKKASLSQEALADLVHVNKYHIAKIELGSSHPSPDLLVDIAVAINTTIDDLLIDNFSRLSSITQIQQLLEGCSPAKEEIIIKNAESLKKILDDLNIK